VAVAVDSQKTFLYLDALLQNMGVLYETQGWHFATAKVFLPGQRKKTCKTKPWFLPVCQQWLCNFPQMLKK